ncbi:hypothetical protein EV207_11863 [Scopulibacillus darangshiensis]|uniref:Uncharacterized protein n=1 Tax=Scopulibacillus darangshiensis TaxID=442528 RepID=A0A4R2P0D5_9BACL|nr:hypothetical protein EV207_11863 [Scopulibacillus darangshiensis]
MEKKPPRTKTTKHKRKGMSRTNTPQRPEPQPKDYEEIEY